MQVPTNINDELRPALFFSRLLPGARKKYCQKFTFFVHKRQSITWFHCIVSTHQWTWEDTIWLRVAADRRAPASAFYHQELFKPPEVSTCGYQLSFLGLDTLTVMWRSCSAVWSLFLFEPAVTLPWYEDDVAQMALLIIERWFMQVQASPQSTSSKNIILKIIAVSSTNVQNGFASLGSETETAGMTQFYMTTHGLFSWIKQAVLSLYTPKEKKKS